MGHAKKTEKPAEADPAGSTDADLLADVTLRAHADGWLNAELGVIGVKVGSFCGMNVNQPLSEPESKPLMM